MAYTWQHLWYVTRAAHHLTEVIADLEVELRKREEDIKDVVDPPPPPPPPDDSVAGPCIPPWQCRMDVAELHRYADELSAYMNKVMERTVSHIAQARERGVTEFLYRVVDTPERPRSGHR